ncbi:MAG: sugar phosphate isomerase/epimerase [Clostridia bacterium]|nr:sugar phosphate isomerase/epimerase [Clostridia bacterium]
MKLITQTEALSQRFGDLNAVRMICESGFDGLDYSMFNMRSNPNYVLNTADYERFARQLSDIVKSYGKTFEQSHAPFPTAIHKNEKYNKEMFEKVKRSIEIAGILNAKIIVIHPVYYKHNKFERNMELYHSLEPFAEEYGVKIAVENMWGRGFKNKIKPNVCSVPDEFNKYVDALGKKNFTACLDLGHCGLVGEDAADMIRKLGGERLGCLHIHDNNFVEDSHTLPYTRDMDWDSVISALKETDYKGHFTYEADNFLKKFPNDLLKPALVFMREVGRSMIDKIENKNEIKYL